MQGHQSHAFGGSLIVVILQERHRIEKLLEVLAANRRLGHRRRKLLEVLPPRDPILGLALVHGEKAGRLEQPTDEVSWRELIASFPGLVEEAEEALQGEPGAWAEVPGQTPRRFRKIDLILVRRPPEHVHGGRADSAGRGVDHALERQQVARPYDEPEIGQGVLDLGALPEPQTAHDPVGHAAAGELLFEGPGLSIGAHQHRHLVQGVTVGQYLHLVHDPARLTALVLGDTQPNRLAALTAGEEALAAATGVGRDEAGRDGEDRRGRTIVLLQRHHPGAGEKVFEAKDVVELGSSPTIDRLVLVADGGEVSHAVEHDPQKIHLESIRILKLVDQEVVRPPRDHPPDLRVMAQSLEPGHQHVVEIDHPGRPLELGVALPDTGQGLVP